MRQQPRHGNTSECISRPELGPNPTLSQKLAEFPPGFRKLAQRQVLGPYSVNYTKLLFSWIQRVPRSPYSITELGHEILDMPNLTITERLLIIGCQAYVDYLEGLQPYWINAKKQDVRNSVQTIDRIQCEAECNNDVLAWCCLVLHATAERGGETWCWADSILNNIQITEERRDELGKNFIVIPTPSRPPSK